MDNEIEKIIGRNIRRLREGCGLTQEMLSARLQIEGCDITRSALAKIEVGQRHIYICGRNNNFKENIERTV